MDRLGGQGNPVDRLRSEVRIERSRFDFDMDDIISTVFKTQPIQSIPHLHPFCLPSDLIPSLVPHDPVAHGHGPAISLKSEDDHPAPAANQPGLPGAATAFGCKICDIEFETNDSQRLHFKSDWHRFNLKLNQSKKDAINEDEFLKMLERLEDSLSGSQSSETDSDDQSEADLQDSQNGGGILQDRFEKLMLSNRCLHSDTTQGQSASSLPTSTRSPLIWFKISPHVYDDPSGTAVQFGLYRCIFPKTFLEDRPSNHNQLGQQYLAELSQLQHSPLTSTIQDNQSSTDKISTWTLLMIGGGHFAGMVVSLAPKLRHLGKQKAPEMEPLILHHKTFHRYTTRRKQGGGQASHDAGGKGPAKSAGAHLRRYNELSLTQDIQDLMNSWSDSIKQSELIFIRSSKSNLKIFFNTPDEDLEFKFQRRDPRIRNLPFVTKRPTLNELKRCFNELTRIKVDIKTKEEILQLEAELEQMRKREEFKREQLMKKKLEKEQEKKAQVKQDKIVNKEQELLLSKWERLIDIVKKGKTEAMKDFVKKYDDQEWFGKVPIELMEHDSMSGCVCLLQLAALLDQAELVTWMLMDCKCDPTIHGQGGGRASQTAYELAGSRLTRNAFRRTMAAHPDWWDWKGEAKVPSGLTEEMESQHANKGKERKSKLKEKLKERDRIRAEAQEQLRQQKEIEEKERKEIEERQRNQRRMESTSSIHRLGGGSVRKTVIKSPEEMIGLTDEQRMRLDRERRARAAEARMK
ncbi:hypothetical protein O181_037504 [Austropuccinia psidii MF-1]|uniref:VLRF1 domain-containing protein n=1 Tax=Austropuccinia psidii MF-1 TaxID=1389203 RepID=A0A9Q3D6N8_9BASI|nr:hypothetical protein [Austropuccinia psidii MF-1]